MLPTEILGNCMKIIEYTYNQPCAKAKFLLFESFKKDFSIHFYYLVYKHKHVPPSKHNIQLSSAISFSASSFLRCSLSRNFSTTPLMCWTSSSLSERRYSNMMSFSSHGFSESRARFFCRYVSLRSFPVIPFRSFLLSHLSNQGGLFSGI